VGVAVEVTATVGLELDLALAPIPRRTAILPGTRL